MRRSTPTALTGIATAALILAACGGGGGTDGAAGSSADESDAPSAVAGKALVQGDLPAGLTVATVDPDQALMSSLQAVQGVKDAKIEPAECLDKSVAAQNETAEIVKFGSRQTVSKDGTAVYGVTLLPGAKIGLFEAAGTGACADVTLNGSMKQVTARKDLPAGTDGSGGFVLDVTRTVGEQSLVASTAYLDKDGVVAIVSANPGADGKIDQAGFDTLVTTVAKKL